MRELGFRAFPEPDPDGRLAPIEEARAQRRLQAAATEAAARRRAELRSRAFPGTQPADVPAPV